jgi:hypothetical protein
MLTVQLQAVFFSTCTNNTTACYTSLAICTVYVQDGN